MKSFSELTSASQVNNGDLLAISQTSGNGYASKKTTVKDITDKSNLNLAEEYDSTSTYAVDDYVIYESVLYKCIGTTTGAFDSTKWTSVVVTDEMGSGGGGGTGGHTIIDENGTSMTARSGLQFFGAVEVTDDSANNRTLVEVLGGDFYNPVIYSFEEREIGVWVDGKPLYVRTYNVTFSSNYTDITIDSTHEVKLLDGGIDSNSNDNFIHLGYGTSQNDMCGAYEYETGKIRFQNFYYSSRPNGWLNVFYTKSTDVAGSGSWTPQGVPTHHYSTDEQIVGTWNGETLYEKTYFNVSITNQANNLVESNFDSHRVLQNFNISTKGMANTLFNYSSSINDTLFIENGDLKYYVSKTGSWWNALDKVDITIQYTKSS